MSVRDYFKSVGNLTERLAALGSPLDSDFQVAVMLKGLSSNFDGLRVAFVAKGVVTLTELRDALETEEQRQMSCTNKTSDSSVLAATSRSSKKQTQQTPVQYGIKERPIGPCFGCHSYGHLHKNCPVNPYVPRFAGRYTNQHAANTAVNAAGNTLYMLF